MIIKKITVFSFLVLLLTNCVEPNAKLEVKKNIYPLYNLESAIIDTNLIIKEKNTYIEKDIINTSVTYFENGLIDYEKSFYLELIPKNLFYTKSEPSYIYLNYFDYHGMDSAFILISYIGNQDSIIYNEKISEIENQKFGKLYLFKEPYINRSERIVFELFSFSNTDIGSKIGIAMIKSVELSSMKKFNKPRGYSPFKYKSM